VVTKCIEMLDVLEHDIADSSSQGDLEKGPEILVTSASTVCEPLSRSGIREQSLKGDLNSQNMLSPRPKSGELLTERRSRSLSRIFRRVKT
jgi:hypothetical protein